MIPSHITVSLCCYYFITTQIILIFLDLNKGDIKDVEMESIMNVIVDNLFSVFVTLGKFKTFIS